MIEKEAVMRKKSLAVLTAFIIIGVSYSASLTTALAGQSKEISDGGGREDAELAEVNSSDKEKEVVKDDSEENLGTKKSGMESLQVPQRLEVVIDPWEMDGKSQIYSDQYAIRNIGETAGVLTLLRLTCKSQEKSSAIVRTDKNGLHDNEEKAVYMEMIFGNGDSVVLSEKESEYRAELKPGEELVLWFTGEVNEYADTGWEDGDITVGVVYSWDEGAIEDALNEEALNPISDIDDNSINEAGDGCEDETAVEIIAEEEKIPRFDEYAYEQKIESEEKVIKIIDLQTIQKSKMVIDTWEMEENNQGNRIVSEEYILRNTGEMAGTLTLSNLRCESKELSGLTIRTDKDGLYESEDDAICIEMELGDEERMILSQESSEYQVELKPGEEVSIQFTGEINKSMPKGLDEGSVEVTAVCSWNT